MSNILTQIKNLLYDLFSWFWSFYEGYIKWVFDSLLSIVDVGLSALTVPTELMTWTFQSIFDNLPQDVLQVLGYVGIPEVLGILSAAFMVRLLLKLIPLL